MLFFTKGYEENLRAIVNGAVFREDHDEMVIVKDIEFLALPLASRVGGLCHLKKIPGRAENGLIIGGSPRSGNKPW